MTPDQSIIRSWRRNPKKFVWDNFKVTPDKWQDEALEAFADPTIPRISLQACAGPGKSAVESWIGLNFLSCYGEVGEHPKGAAVSITWDNLKDNLWPEFAKWLGRSKWLGSQFTWTKERIFAKDHPETWFISARSWPKNANAEEQGQTLSGLHSKFVLALVDESGGVPVTVLKAAEQALSNCAFGKIVQAGNPVSLEGMLYAAATILAHLWKIIRINGDPDDPNRSPRISIEWARQQIATYGRDNPWVMSYILGKFPPSSINVLLGPEEVDAAMKRQVRPDAYLFSQKRIGVDAARFGDDPWVIFPRQGLRAFNPVEMRNPRSQEVAARVAAGKIRWGSELEAFDGTGGYAAGAIDAMIQGGHAPLEISFNGKAIDPRYFNKRAELWFGLAEWVKRGGSLPNIPQLTRELTAPTYTYMNGKFQLEEKAQIKKRLGFSPNYGDALALTFCLPEMPAAQYAEMMQSQGGKLQSDWDPHSPEHS